MRVYKKERREANVTACNVCGFKLACSGEFKRSRVFGGLEALSDQAISIQQRTVVDITEITRRSKRFCLDGNI